MSASDGFQRFQGTPGYIASGQTYASSPSGFAPGSALASGSVSSGESSYAAEPAVPNVAPASISS